jgi:hypothetical protein
MKSLSMLIVGILQSQKSLEWRKTQFLIPSNIYISYLLTASEHIQRLQPCQFFKKLEQC